MIIHISKHGYSLGKTSERLVVRDGQKKIITEVPFFNIDQIVIESKGVSLSSDLIKSCARNKIEIEIMANGQPVARISPLTLTGTVATRRQQLAAYTDGRGIELARHCIMGKIKNQVTLIKYTLKYKSKKELADDLFVEQIIKIENILHRLKAVSGKNIDDCRAQFLVLEAQASKKYWQLFARLIRNRILFEGRQHRGAADPVNSLLNYGYAILYNRVARAVLRAGLDPFAGFLHVDRPGRESMVLDLMEEFRPVLVDRTVIAHVNLSKPLDMDGKLLADQTKRAFTATVLKKLGNVYHYRGSEEKLDKIIQKQAINSALFLRGEKEYKPFVARW